MNMRFFGAIMRLTKTVAYDTIIITNIMWERSEYPHIGG